MVSNLRDFLRYQWLVLILVPGLALYSAAALSQPTFQQTPGVNPQKPAEKGEPSVGQPRTDLHGDPLPAGALARLGTDRFRNSNGFLSLAYTPDGKFLVAGSWGPAVVWDAATGKVVRRMGAALPGASGPASLSSDGKLAAVGGWGPANDTAGAVYAVATGQRLYGFGNQGGQNTSARFSPDGKVLAVHGLNTDIQLHDAQTGKRLRLLVGHKRGDGGLLYTVADVLFSPDSKLLFSAGNDGTIRQWDVASGTERLQLNGGADGVSQLALSPDGKLLVSHAYARTQRAPGQFLVTTDCRLHLWDLMSGKGAGEIDVPCVADKAGIAMGPTLLGFTPDGKSILTSGSDEVLRIWGARTTKELRHMKHPDGAPRAIAFAPDGKTMACVESYKALRIREYPSGRELFPADGHGSGIEEVAIAPDGKTVATAADGGAILVWDAATSRVKARLAPPKAPRTLDYSHDGRTLFTAGNDQPLLAWDVATGKELWRTDVHQESTGRLGLAPDGRTLAWAGKPDSILLIDVATGKALRELPAPKTSPRGLCFAPDGAALLAWDDDKRLVHWDVKTGQRQDKPLEGLPDYPFAVRFSPDRDLVAFGGQQGDVILVQVATGREIHRVAKAPVASRGQDGVFCTIFSPDGRTLAWAGAIDGLVHLTEAATGKERRRLAGHRAGVRALAFSADGRILVSGAEDTTSLVWGLTGPVAWGTEQPGSLNDASLTACWEDLRGDDTAKAYVAVRRLIADPARAVPYLAQRLRPAVPPDEKRVARLVADIDSDDFAARDGAVKELERTGDLVLPALRKALAGKSSLEMRRRIDQLVEKLETITSERLRAIRAIEALEYAGTPQARQLLAGLAEGAAGARKTMEARASLERLNKRK